MRSPGVIYRRYRQLKKKILYDRILEARKRIFDNCYYGKKVTFLNDSNVEHIIKMCNYSSLPDDRVELCFKPDLCNAFVNKRKKEEIIKDLEKDLSNYEIKKRYYPDLILLEWVLDKDLNEAVKKPNFIGRLIIFCIDFLEFLLKKTKKVDYSIEE
jgi:hypothetical protein